MNDRRPYSLLEIRELGHGVHDLTGFDTSYVRLFGVRDTALTNPPAVEVLLASAEGATFLAMVSRN